MRKSVATAVLVGVLAGASAAEAADTKIGALMDVTGPLASFMPPLHECGKLRHQECE